MAFLNKNFRYQHCCGL